MCALAPPIQQIYTGPHRRSREAGASGAFLCHQEWLPQINSQRAVDAALQQHTDVLPSAVVWPDFLLCSKFSRPPPNILQSLSHKHLNQPVISLCSRLHKWLQEFLLFPVLNMVLQCHCHTSQEVEYISPLLESGLVQWDTSKYDSKGIEVTAACSLMPTDVTAGCLLYNGRQVVKSSLITQLNTKQAYKPGGPS